MDCRGQEKRETLNPKGTAWWPVVASATSWIRIGLPAAFTASVTVWHERALTVPTYSRLPCAPWDPMKGFPGEADGVADCASEPVRKEVPFACGLRLDLTALIHTS
jgi:hypothetical protein